MPSVTGLSIKRQSGTSNTYYATWDFDDFDSSMNLQHLHLL